MTAPTRPPAATGDVAAYRGTMSEKSMQDGLLAAARRLNYRAYHTYNSRRSEFGFPDVVILGHGHIIALELKGTRGRVTEAQRGWIEAFRQNGAVALIVWPESYQDVLNLLQQIRDDAVGVHFAEEATT